MCFFQATRRRQFAGNLLYLRYDVFGCNSDIWYSLWEVNVRSNFAIVYEKGISINLQKS